MKDAPIEYTDVVAVDGPLVTVRGVRDVGWDEGARLRLASGEERHGVVLDVDDDRAVVQVYEGTSGIRPDETSVAFVGGPIAHQGQ